MSVVNDFLTSVRTSVPLLVECESGAASAAHSGGCLLGRHCHSPPPPHRLGAAPSDGLLLYFFNISKQILYVIMKYVLHKYIIDIWIHKYDCIISSVTLLAFV